MIQIIDLLEAYISAGFDPSAFGRLTPRLFLVHMRGARKRMELERQASVESAWLTATLMRQKKIPSIRALLAPPKPLRGKEVLNMLRVRTKNLPKRTWEEWLKVSSAPSE